jgi:hypothetical protein
MKHISAYLGGPKERVEEKFAWFPTRSSFSKKRIWFKKYVVVKIYYDDMGRPPIKGITWDLIYTQNEYLMYLLKKDETKVY